MRLAKVIFAFVLAVPRMILSEFGWFITLREVIYRSAGKQTDMSKLYTLTDKEAIILNSVDFVWEVLVFVMLLRWLIQKKYNNVIIAAIIVWAVFFAEAHFEEAWRK